VFECLTLFSCEPIIVTRLNKEVMYMKDKSGIGRVLNRYLTMLAISTSDFAVSYGCSPSYIHRVINEGVSRDSTMFKLARCLDVDLETFVEDCRLECEVSNDNV